MPSTRNKPAHTDARAGVAMPYAINGRITQEQLDALVALEQREGLSRSEAIRRAIDEWRESRVFDVSVVTKMGFTAVPELDHIEFAIEARRGDGRIERQGLNLDLDLAHQLLGDLAAAVEQLEGDQ